MSPGVAVRDRPVQPDAAAREADGHSRHVFGRVGVFSYDAWRSGGWSRIISLNHGGVPRGARNICIARVLLSAAQEGCRKFRRDTLAEIGGLPAAAEDREY